MFRFLCDLFCQVLLMERLKLTDEEEGKIKSPAKVYGFACRTTDLNAVNTKYNKLMAYWVKIKSKNKNKVRNLISLRRHATFSDKEKMACNMPKMYKHEWFAFNDRKIRLMH